MEEDIEILEEYLLNLKKFSGEEIIKSDEILKFIDYKEIKAIKNLIKGYRELEERIIYLVNERKKLEELLFASNENYIEKSKVKEKIEELEKRKRDLLRLPSDCGRSIALEDCDDKIGIYKELMEDK